MNSNNKIWKKSLPEETDFWSRWLQTKGFTWPEEYVERLNPDAVLPDYLACHIVGIPKETIDILDVGAGPLTRVGKKYPGKVLRITAIDPLAEQYERLLAKHKVKPLVRTIYGEAERLDRLFPANQFDLVTAINCIDHSYDPLTAVRQMVRVARPGRVVFLSHQENEGERENYAGLHQFDLTSLDGDFIIRGRDGKFENVSKVLAGIAHVECQLFDHWLTVILTKL